VDDAAGAAGGVLTAGAFAALCMRGGLVDVCFDATAATQMAVAAALGDDAAFADAPRPPPGAQWWSSVGLLDASGPAQASAFGAQPIAARRGVRRGDAGWAATWADVELLFPQFVDALVRAAVAQYALGGARAEAAAACEEDVRLRLAATEEVKRRATAAAAAAAAAAADEAKAGGRKKTADAKAASAAKTPAPKAGAAASGAGASKGKGKGSGTATPEEAEAADKAPASAVDVAILRRPPRSRPLVLPLEAADASWGAKVEAVWRRVVWPALRLAPPSA
jgi:hypothetical protein